MINLKFNITILVMIVAVLIVGSGCDISSNVKRQTSKASSDKVSQVIKNRELVSTKFVDSYEFARSAGVGVKEVDGHPVAGIVNHHSLAMDLQARFFKSLKATRPDVKKFVIVSPDHFLAGDLVSTHDFAYSTPAGEVGSLALDVTGIFQAKDVKVFANEHGVGALTPFIAREFPGSVIVPVYVRPEATRLQLQKIGQEIAEVVDEDAFVIISSDMSHYLSDYEARENDEITLSWIRSMNWEKLQSATDDYTDSAQGFVVLQAIFESLKHDVDFELLDYAISTDYGADANETTSYINGFYVIADSR
ncbi:MAG: AmmeMemoRadiSam system protein B [Patescibacteria group bacterium]|nr:AmmeMemoRadiSam system protein B [Patescibacteria group bacterium]